MDHLSAGMMPISVIGFVMAFLALRKVNALEQELRRRDDCALVVAEFGSGDGIWAEFRLQSVENLVMGHIPIFSLRKSHWSRVACAKSPGATICSRGSICKANDVGASDLLLWANSLPVTVPVRSILS